MMSRGKSIPVIWIIFINSWISVQGTPLNLPKLDVGRNVHLMATLTNMFTSEKYQMEEDLAELNIAQGRINITKGSKITTIFYNDNDEFRLVMNENDCQSYVYQMKDWNRLLPGVTSAFENYLLLYGPSIYFRIITWVTDSSVPWIQGPTQTVRSLTMNTKSINVPDYLNVTVSYYGEDGAFQPSRVEVTGSLPPSVHSGPSNTEHLIIDFYTITYSNEDLEKIVKPTPGIGCLKYLEENRPLPELKSSRIHYVEVEYESDAELSAFLPSHDKNNRLNMYLDIDNGVIHKSAENFGARLRSVSDTNLGITYWMDSSKTCKQKAILSNDPAFFDGQLNAKALLWMIGPFKYLGETFYDRRSGILCKVWETMQFDVDLNLDSYDKLVTTLYFTKVASIGTNLPDYYAPVGMTKKGYKKDKSGAFILHWSEGHEIYEFSPAIADSEYRSLFQVTECFEDPSLRRTFHFDIRPTYQSRFNSSMAEAEDNLYTFRDELTKLIVQRIPISPLRIASMDFDFSSQGILAKVLFVEKPPLSANYMQGSLTVKLNDKTMVILQTRNSAESCLEMVTNDPNLKTALWCPGKDGMNSCVKVYNSSDIAVYHPEAVPCESYERGVADFSRITREVPLASLHDELLSSLGNETFTLGVRSGPYSVKSVNDFRVHDIIEDMPDDVKGTKFLFFPLYAEKKLDESLSYVRKDTGTIRNFGDCYRACQNSDIEECKAFSYCFYGDGQFDCLISDQIESDEDPAKMLKDDAKCSVYMKSKMADFTKIKGREFRKEHPVFEVDLEETEEQCAWRCANSKDCRMFEFGAFTPCKLYSGFYDDSMTFTKEDSNIYIAKKSSNFKLTGRVVAPKTMFTVVDLNFEQCAQLCYDYKGGEDACRSFNYCPKGASVSSCQLVGGTGGTPIPSNDCYNYALEGKVDQPSVSSYTEEKVKTSAGKVFGIVLGFTFLGIVLGLLAQFLYFKHVRGASVVSLISRRMPWSRHIDEDDAL